MKLGRFGKSDITSQNKRTIYNVYKFFRVFSEQPEHFSNINIHRTQEITVKACEVHCSTVQNVCNEGFNFLLDSQLFASSGKAYIREHDDADLNGFDKDVPCQYINFMTGGNILQHQS
jgi:hypothetical protein